MHTVDRVRLKAVIEQDAARVRFGRQCSVTQHGARAEGRFTRPSPLTLGVAHRTEDEHLDGSSQIFFANCGIIKAPFHHMALMCSNTKLADVDVDVAEFGRALAELFQ